MKLYIVRHGDKLKGNYYNEHLRIHDYPLSKQGIREAKRLWRFFKNVAIDEVYVSQYKRTAETANYVAQRKGLNIVVDKRLNEINNGVIEKMDHSEIKEKYPDFWDSYNRLDQDFQYPEGESGEEVLRRFLDFIEEKKTDKKNMMLVTHDGMMRIIMCHVFNIPSYKRFNMKVDTCGIIELEYIEDRQWWNLIRFNYKVK